MSICDKYLQHSSSNKADTDLMVYWIIEYAGINTKTTKDYLDNVLEGDEASNREEMRMKMQKIRLSEN